jgi:hypothetical protein
MERRGLGGRKRANQREQKGLWEKQGLRFCDGGGRRKEEGGSKEGGGRREEGGKRGL